MFTEIWPLMLPLTHLILIKDSVSSSLENISNINLFDFSGIALSFYILRDQGAFWIALFLDMSNELSVIDIFHIDTIVTKLRRIYKLVWTSY